MEIETKETQVKAMYVGDLPFNDSLIFIPIPKDMVSKLAI